jgi:hypothetical protein
MTSSERGEVIASRRDDKLGRWRPPSRRARASVGTVVLVAVAAAILQAVDLSGKAAPDAAGHGAPREAPQATSAAAPPAEPSPVRVPPLCAMRTDFRLVGEPVMDGPPDCPGSTPAGNYVSAAFIGHTGLIPYTFTLPDGWRVVSHGFGNVVDLRTRGRTAISVVSDPRDVGSRTPTTPERLLRRLASRSADLTVSSGTRSTAEGPPWWQEVEVSARRGAEALAGCRRGVPCVPVLTSGFGFPEGTRPAVVGVRAGSTALLLLNTVIGANLAVWVWDLGDDFSEQALAVARSIRLRPVRPATPY